MWSASAFIDKAIRDIRRVVGDNHVLSACSGGVDSTTVTALVHRAVGDRMTAVFIDDGLRRQGEPAFVVQTLQDMGIPTRLVDAHREFFASLKGKTDAEEKRKAFRDRFYTILGRVAREEEVTFLAQGTIKADVMETVQGIKTQHNVLEQIGIDPAIYGYAILEPLKELFKPEVRQVARALGLPAAIAERMPFPGPALSIRVIGEVTPEKVAVCRQATAIVEAETQHLDAFQSFAVLHNDRATGMKAGKRVYGHIITVRVVASQDAVTAKAYPVPSEVLARIAERVTQEIPSVVRCLYDVTHKPPATIEFE